MLDLHVRCGIDVEQYDRVTELAEWKRESHIRRTFTVMQVSEMPSSLVVAGRGRANADGILPIMSAVPNPDALLACL